MLLLFLGGCSLPLAPNRVWQTTDNTDSRKISRPNRYAVQTCGFWQAADQVRILHRLTGRSLAEIVDHAHRDHQVALWIGRIADEREVRAVTRTNARPA